MKVPFVLYGRFESANKKESDVQPILAADVGGLPRKCLKVKEAAYIVSKILNKQTKILNKQTDRQTNTQESLLFIFRHAVNNEHRKM